MINEWFIFHLYKVSKRKCACLVDLLFFLPFNVPLQSSLSKPCILKTKSHYLKFSVFFNDFWWEKQRKFRSEVVLQVKLGQVFRMTELNRWPKNHEDWCLDKWMTDWLIWLLIYIWRNNRFCLTWRLEDKACLTADRMANRMTSWQTNWMTGNCKQFDYDRLTLKPSFLKSFRSGYLTLINVIFFCEWLNDCPTEWQTSWRTKWLVVRLTDL